MKNFRKIGSSFLDRLCGIWSPIPLEVRSCALRQSISTPPWQQQCSPNDCTMGSKLFCCVKNILPCKNYFIVSELFYCVKTTLLRQIISLCQTMEVLKKLRTTTCSILWKTMPNLTQKSTFLSQTWQLINFFWWMLQCMKFKFVLFIKILKTSTLKRRTCCQQCWQHFSLLPGLPNRVISRRNKNFERCLELLYSLLVSNVKYFVIHAFLDSRGFDLKQ